MVRIENHGGRGRSVARRATGGSTDALGRSRKVRGAAGVVGEPAGAQPRRALRKIPAANALAGTPYRPLRRQFRKGNQDGELRPSVARLSPTVRIRRGGYSDAFSENRGNFPHGLPRQCQPRADGRRDASGPGTDWVHRRPTPHDERPDDEGAEADRYAHALIEWAGDTDQGAGSPKDRDGV